MKPIKALILGILLLVPILIFIFVSVFGTHHFSLKTYYPRFDDAGKVVYDAAGDTVFQQVSYFTLTSQEGVTVTQDDLDNTIYIVNLFNTACQDTCQETFSELQRVNEVFANNPQVKLVSITTSPTTDSVHVLKEFADNMGVDSQNWLLLTGDQLEVYTLADKGFHRPITLADSEPQYSHDVLLVDKEKLIRGVYKGTDRTDVDRLVTEIKVLLDEYSKRK
ncbi:SCO family protein [Pontibacter oryzae]|uniref:SCO family protein n=1 Tax=Pontibacter oryzae TaxID=2304593 RepID=A0A399RQF7_9BACT|nr:SCO family protein [Pontibacter oryzae]RIJ33418.1 SCO family protein [Pontibacter oryzae]